MYSVSHLTVVLCICVNVQYMCTAEGSFYKIIVLGGSFKLSRVHIYCSILI